LRIGDPSNIIWALEKELADSDSNWTSFNTATGGGIYLFVGSGNINQIKKIDITSLSVVSTLTLSQSSSGINAIWSN
jgi:hypothetical protein